LENITHTLTGYFLSRAGLNRVSPQATLLLMFSANAPDIDILALAGGGLNYFDYHRHLTHSLIFAPVLSALLVAIFRLVQRLTGQAPIPSLSSFWVALAGIGSHLLLDLTNNYGERLLLPFSGQWLALDLCAIYDLWIWAIFLFCLAAPFLSDLVGGEIGAAARSRYPSRFFPCLALILLVFYDGGRFVLHQRALAIVDARQYDGANALRVAAFPNPSNPARWQALAETASSYRVYDLNLFGPLGGFFDPGQGQTLFKSERTPYIDAANQAEPFRVLRDFARFPLWHAIQTDHGTKVTLFDVRFPFLAEAELDRAGKIETSAFLFSR
jgi:inner membrane protein